MDAELITKILYEYELDRQTAKTRRQKKLECLYRELPELEQLDQELFEAGINATATILKDPAEGKAAAEHLKAHIAALTSSREKLLKTHGYAADYTDLQYNCRDCLDTGYVGSKKCSCLEQRLINEAYKNSNLSKLFDSQDFDSFDFSYYSKTVDPKEGVSPYERMQDIYNTCKEFAYGFNNAKSSLFFYGNVGLGKTFLSSAIAKVVLSLGKTVVYQSATKLFSGYGDYIFSRTDAKEAKPQIQKLFDADLLVMDDLGTEAVSSYTVSFLFELLNERVLAGKKTIISTNLTISELPKVYSSRLHSRILEHFMPLKFIGKDNRQQKMMK